MRFINFSMKINLFNKILNMSTNIFKEWLLLLSNLRVVLYGHAKVMMEKFNQTFWPRGLDRWVSFLLTLKIHQE